MIPYKHDVTPPCEGQQYDEVLDNIISLLSDACRTMSASGGYSFSLTSPVARHIVVDVGTDLAIALEQIPSLLAWLRNESSNPFSLDLYEQGVSLQIDLTKIPGAINIRFMQFPNAIEYGCETVSARSIETATQQVLDTFVDFVRSHCYTIFIHPWFQEWLASDIHTIW